MENIKAVRQQIHVVCVSVCPVHFVRTTDRRLSGRWVEDALLEYSTTWLSVLGSP